MVAGSGMPGSSRMTTSPFLLQVEHLKLKHLGHWHTAQKFEFWSISGFTFLDA
jgi:hypothetical protein